VSTTSSDIDTTPKKFSFSYSALKNWQTCPRRFYETTVAKPRIYPERTSPELEEGHKIHAELAHSLQTGEPHEKYQKWIDKFNSVPGKPLIEQKLAIDRNFNTASWFSDAAWYRVAIDAAKINLEKTDQEYALAVDWKTGQSRNVEDSLQLTLTALALFIHYPDIKMVGTRYVWLKEGRQTKHIVKYDEIGDRWQEILPLVDRLEQAHAKNSFPPKPGRLCRRYCPVTSCEFYGK
jgi:CRISPR/Cas system-associated exonuclease Cas4 (RecB family)